MSEYDVIPDHILWSINAYVKYGQYPGKFIESVVSNNLSESIAYADKDCQRALAAIVKYFYNKTPGICWGDKDKFSAWCRQRGAEGGSGYELNLIEREDGHECARNAREDR